MLGAVQVEQREITGEIFKGIKSLKDLAPIQNQWELDT